MTGNDIDREGFAALLLRARSAGIGTPALIAALEATPRRSFIPGQWQDAAWLNQMLPIPCGEAIEGVDLQLLALSALQLEPNCRVLEIGTGTGFTAAVMARLATRVLTIERFKTLVSEATLRMETLGLNNVLIRHGDGSGGAPSEGPFDRIIVWAAFDSLPRGFVDQLTTGGVMIAPIGPGDDVQKLARLSKIGSRFEREDIADVRLQPIMKGMAAAL